MNSLINIFTVFLIVLMFTIKVKGQEVNLKRLTPIS